MINLLIFTICFFAVVTGILYWLIKGVQKIHDEIDKIHSDAKIATTKSELELVWERLKATSRKCWHYDFESRIVEVKTFIQTKYQYCK